MSQTVGKGRSLNHQTSGTRKMEEKWHTVSEMLRFISCSHLLMEK
ncbi:hypothetical protein [Leptolyngbya sp. FACHB-541]|nr:hypothetical protein [Leptolyngbya sp. FACHB-541]